MSFFKAPSWAQPQVAKPEQKADDDLFSHKSSFLSIFKESAEREKRDKEHEERRRIKKEKRKSSEKRKSDEGEKGELKKRRITSEEGSKLLAQIGLGQGVVDLSSEDEEPQSQQQLPVRRSPRNQRVVDVLSPRRHKDRLAAPVVFDDNSEDDIEITAIETRKVQAPPEPEEDEDSDPEIAELRRKAREKARAKQPLPKAKASSSDPAHEPEPTLYTPPALDPVVKILITSELPNTKPLMICRKLSQRLREVREMWCRKQGFSEDDASQIFLSHRGRKFWDSSTVKRLGLEADAGGRVYRIDDPTKEGVDQVHVEAVTPELFEELKAEKVRQEKAASGVPDLEEEAAVEGAAAEAAPTQKKGIRLVVKAKGHEPWKIQVTENTSIAKLLKLGKKALGFAEGQNVYLEFDGERLNPNGTVGDTEIEDMDCVDMHPEG